MTKVAGFAKFTHRFILRLGASVAVLGSITAPLAAQPVQPPAQQRGGIDSDLAQPGGANAPAVPPPPAPAYPPASNGYLPPEAPPPAQAAVNVPPPGICGHASAGEGYQSDDLIGAAGGVFGSGAHGLADLIRDILRKQGLPDGYIAGREAGGAFAIGLRYGSGTLCQKDQPPRAVYWTGPSIGFDVGANAAQTFVLVYNLHNQQDIFRRFGAGEGQAYIIGGFNVSYLRRGDVVLIPVRLGVGLRLGINAGWMKIRPHQNWVPF